MTPEASFPQLSKASLWLETFRKLQDSGMPLREARRVADEALGFARAESARAA